jgi:hypothetical protein
MICSICKKEVELVKKRTDEFGKVINYFSCGHELVEVYIVETGKAYERLGIKKKGQEKFSKKHKFEYEVSIGETVGRDGKPAFIHQIIDRTKNYYKKFVKQGDKIIKNIEEKLTEHK